MLSKIIVALSFLAVSFAGKAPLAEYTFEQYVAEYHLKYDTAEIPMRKELFSAELVRVLNHNSKNVGWYEGFNKFSLLTKAEKQAYFGRSKGANKAYESGNKPSELKAPADMKIEDVQFLPTHVDWRLKNVVSAVKDQGYCGSCWAFASTATLESHVAIQSGLLFDLSVEQMAMCAPNPNQCGGTGGCMGSTAELAFTYLAKSKGIFQEYQYGYTSYYGQNFNCTQPLGTKPVASINGYVQLPGNDYKSLMNTLAKVGPVAINVDASTWHGYVGGIYNGCNQESPDVNHVVVAVGYGEETDGSKYWLVRNSWNANWGEAGYIRLARFDNDEERCGMDETPQDGVACAGQTDAVKVCGTCGAIYDSSYPTGAKAL